MKAKKNYPPTPGMKVQIYWNLRDDCYSVMCLEGEDYGHVIFYANAFRLEDASFIVRSAGREQVRRRLSKNVHAFIKGRWSNGILPQSSMGVTYNPYVNDTFVNVATGEPVSKAALAMGVAVGGKPKVFAWPPA